MTMTQCSCWGLPGMHCVIHGQPIPGVPPPHVRYATEAEWQASRAKVESKQISAGLSPLSALVVRRLNVDHLSIGMGDHKYMWRSSLTGQLIAWWETTGWLYRDFGVGRDKHFWHRVANTGVKNRPGERFIRVAERNR